MDDKRTVLVVFGYSDGSYEYAAGDHGREVGEYLGHAQAMVWIQGGLYRGRKTILVPAPDDLEPIKPIAERTFPEWVEELSRKQQDG